MSSRNDRAINGPSWTEVTIGALLSVGIGALLAGAWLTLKPVEKVRSLPDEPKPGVVYFVEGARNGSIGSAWERKTQLFATGVSVDLVEQELNEAARQLSSDAQQAKGKDAKDGIITPGQLNFRISDGELQVALPLALNLYGMKSDVQVVARGGFVKKGERFVYEPTSIYVGSCPIERLPQIGGVLLGKIWEAMSQQEEIKAAWDALENVTVEGRSLRLVAQ